MASADPADTALNPDPDAGDGAMAHPRIVLVDARAGRRTTTARQLAAGLPGVRISECSDMSEALFRVAAQKHDLIVLDVASCGTRERLASQYWQLTAPNMQQVLVHDDAVRLLHLEEADWPDVVHCSWREIPGSLLSWAQRYRRAAEPAGPAASRSTPNAMLRKQ